MINNNGCILMLLDPLLPIGLHESTFRKAEDFCHFFQECLARQRKGETAFCSQCVAIHGYNWAYIMNKLLESS